MYKKLILVLFAGIFGFACTANAAVDAAADTSAPVTTSGMSTTAKVGIAATAAALVAGGATIAIIASSHKSSGDSNDSGSNDNPSPNTNTIPAMTIQPLPPTTKAYVTIQPSGLPCEGRNISVALTGSQNYQETINTCSSKTFTVESGQYILAASNYSSSANTYHPQLSNPYTINGTETNPTVITIPYQQQSQDTSVFSPYYDFTLGGDPNNQASTIVALKTTPGIKHITLAFINGQSDGSCNATWGGYADYSVANNSGKSAIDAFGPSNVTISFGGLIATSYLENICNTANALYEQYQKVVTNYGVTDLDFDIENWYSNDPDARTRMITALHTLQTNYPQVKISFTLPSAPGWGLGGDTSGNQAIINFLTQAKQAGVSIHQINIMTMDYGWLDKSWDPSYDYWVATRDHVIPLVVQQLKNIFTDKSEAQIYQMLRITPMIGQNDTGPRMNKPYNEVFTTPDMQNLVEYAKTNGCAVSFWSISRDDACVPDHTDPISPNTYASNYCSGYFDIDGDFQNDFQDSNYEFSNIAKTLYN